MTGPGEALIEAAHQEYLAGAFAAAETILRMALGRSGNDAHVLYFIGHLAYQQGRLDDAVWFLQRSLELGPEQARAHNDLGESLRALGRPEEALPHLEKAVALEPSLAHGYGNLATVLVTLDRPEDALRWAQEALRRAEDKVVAHCDLGSVFGRLNRAKEAVRQFDLALERQPGNPRPRYYRALMRLSLGDLPDAWPDHEARLALPGVAAARDGARWTGAQDVSGRALLLHAEQGFGDTVQFVRYVPMAAALGARVTVQVQRGLGALCQGIGGATVVEEGEAMPGHDLYASLLSLPAIFRTGMASIPGGGRYLTADPLLRAAWAERLGPWRRMRVGVAWSGSAGHAADRSRSMALAKLAPLLRRRDIDCHVVQRDISAADRAALGDFPDLARHSAELTDFAQTAALLAGLDLVVTVDTAVAHLAGALGVPAWVMLAHAADWRWLRDRDDSPWYPSLRLFRQKRRGDWDSVLEPLCKNLDAWAVRHG
jgi:hypothetical protein